MHSTRTLLRAGDRDVVRYPAVTVRLTPPNGAPLEAPLGLEGCSVGTDPTCTLVCDDPSVSRRHVSLRIDERGVVLTDLGSKNGTFVSGLRVTEVVLPFDTPAELGGSRLVLVSEGREEERALSAEPRFGDAVGMSPPMRALFETLRTAAATEVPVMLLGESGTGKDVLARALHAHSTRKDRPFVVVDCSAIAPSLIEAELFGHAKGAFTGADASRAGLFEQAHGGTLFLDELGELPLELQTRLLRVLETRQVRRIGEAEHRPADARIIGATHRDLQAGIRSGTFRQDLYFRLAVVMARIPPLRERKEDVPLLSDAFLSRQRPPRSVRDLPPHAMEMLRAHDWPGNVRELHNVLTRLLLFPNPPADLLSGSGGAGASAANTGNPYAGFLALPLREAREALVADFEATYLRRKLEETGGKVSAAAKAMGISRQFVYLMMSRYGFQQDPDD